LDEAANVFDWAPDLLIFPGLVCPLDAELDASTFDFHPLFNVSYVIGITTMQKPLSSPVGNLKPPHSHSFEGLFFVRLYWFLRCHFFNLNLFVGANRRCPYDLRSELPAGEKS
jgi:hypothetical protein